MNIRARHLLSLIIVTAIVASYITRMMTKFASISNSPDPESRHCDCQSPLLGSPSSTHIHASELSKPKNPDAYVGSDPVVLVMCLSDATDGQLDEIQVALKSVLYQAPPPGSKFSSLKIYFVASDTISVTMLHDMLEKGKLSGSLWPIPISIAIVDVSELNKRFYNDVVRGPGLNSFHVMHNVGAFWRLMLPWVLPDEVEHVIYIDTDVWFRDNIAGMWLERNTTSLLQWTTDVKISAVMILNLPVMKKSLWKAWGAAACAGLRENFNETGRLKNKPFFNRRHIKETTGDQAFLQSIVEYLPSLEGELSPPYGRLHFEFAYKWYKLREKWMDMFEGGAVLHNNGGGRQNRHAYWRMFLPNATAEQEGTILPPHKNDLVFRTVSFIVDLPWHWLLYHAKVYNRVLDISGLPLTVSTIKIPADHAPFNDSVNEANKMWDRATSLVSKTSEDCMQIYSE